MLFCGLRKVTFFVCFARQAQGENLLLFCTFFCLFIGKITQTCYFAHPVKGELDQAAQTYIFLLFCALRKITKCCCFAISAKRRFTYASRIARSFRLFSFCAPGKITSCRRFLAARSNKMMSIGAFSALCAKLQNVEN